METPDKVGLRGESCCERSVAARRDVAIHAFNTMDCFAIRHACTRGLRLTATKSPFWDDGSGVISTFVSQRHAVQSDVVIDVVEQSWLTQSWLKPQQACPS